MAEREKLIEVKDLQISFGKGRKKFVDLFCLIIALESFLASFIQSLMCGGLHQGLAPVYSINVLEF